VIRFQCPNCGAVLKIEDYAAGRRGWCPNCFEWFQAPGLASDPTPEPAPKPATNTRSVISLTLGVLSVLGGYVTVEGLGVGFVLTLPLSIAGLILAIIAWRRQERGEMTIVALVLNPVAVVAGLAWIMLVWRQSSGR
jgi:hypothetical protein